MEKEDQSSLRSSIVEYCTVAFEEIQKGSKESSFMDARSNLLKNLSILDNSDQDVKEDVLGIGSSIWNEGYS